MTGVDYLENVYQSYIQYDVMKPIVLSKKVKYELFYPEPSIAIVATNDNTIMIVPERDCINHINDLINKYNGDLVSLTANMPKVISVVSNEETIENIIDIVTSDMQYEEKLSSLIKSIENKKSNSFTISQK